MTRHLFKVQGFLIGIIILIVLFWVSGCEPSPKGEAAKEPKQIEVGQATLSQDTGDAQAKQSERSASVQLRWENGDSLLIATVAAKDLPQSIKVEVKHVYQQIHLIIEDLVADSLQGRLHFTEGERNLRFNQVILPDGTMDGPFSKEISYDTPQKGRYTLIIGKDNMADGQVAGPVDIDIKITK